MTWDYPNPFTRLAVPRPEDIDGLNHTNNAVYVQWCEKIGWAHSESLGLSLQDYRRLDRAMAIRRGGYDSLLPMQLGEALGAGLHRAFQRAGKAHAPRVLPGLSPGDGNPDGMKFIAS
jgi:acyl-CoA thioester hydrolase